MWPDALRVEGLSAGGINGWSRDPFPVADLAPRGSSNVALGPAERLR